jgi:translation initiation factor IF-2
MRDISELPGDIEQAKQASENTLKPRSTSRSKPEHGTTSSQDQETKPAPRRRNTTVPRQHSTGNSGESPRASRGDSQGSASANPRPAPQDGFATNPRPAPQGSSRSTVSSRPIPEGGSTPNASRPAGTVSSPRNPTRANAATSNPMQRSQGGTPTQRTQNVGTQSSAPSRSGGFNRSAGGQQGQYTPQARTNNQSQRSPTERGAGQSTHTQGQRPGHNGASRPGTHTSPGKRPAQRQSSNAPRTQDRRAPVVKEKPTGPITLPPQTVVKDLAELLHSSPIEVIKGLIKHGVFANINQVVDYEKAALVAKDLGYEPSPYTASESQDDRPLSANEAMIAAREGSHTVTIPPVVTIMGHVDHGKTSLLDTIRKTKVAAGEAGGITQHIGAYQVEVNGKKITFLDTPGHEAFTAMRARGAQGANIAIIVIAADDGIMPQTREAIDHAKAAKVPIIITLNKIDKANANPDRVKQQLAEIDVLIEEFGGDTICVPISARKGTGIDELLEYILLVAEVQDIRANPNRPATGVILEAKMEKNSGVTATVLVQQGTLKMGDNFVVGSIAGKVRAMFNDRGKRIQKAPPSTPVSILGLPEVPQAGDQLTVVTDEKTAKQSALQEAKKRRSESAPLGQVSLDTLYMQMQEGTVKELNIVLKCDVQGSSEAIKNSLSKLGEENLKVRMIHEGIGNISETDVHLAAASGAIIIGFHVKADGAAQREAQREGVDIRYYDVIYKLLEDIEAALTGMLEPTYREVIDGHAEVIQLFKAGRNIIIAGCRVTNGKLARSTQVRILRKDEKIFEGKIGSLRRGKDDVREVASGYECGIVIEDFTTFEVGDIIEAFSQERVKIGA